MYAFRAEPGLAGRVLTGDPGWVAATDPATGRPFVYFIAPIASVGWTFVAISAP